MENDDGAQYDMSFSTLGRLNFWLWKCDEAGFKDDPIMWFRALKIVYKETHAFMNKKEKAAHHEYHKDTERAYSDFLKFQSEFDRHKRFMIRFTPPREIFDNLFSWELALRDVLDRNDILMKSKEDSSKAFQ